MHFQYLQTLEESNEVERIYCQRKCEMLYIVVQETLEDYSFLNT